MLRFLQNHPGVLETIYSTTWAILLPLRYWLKPGGKTEWLFANSEKVFKSLIFDCRMCGDCVLQSTGMTCPMTCPKNLRNGPCGGVRPNGNCEVKPSMPCVWVQAWERSTRMPKYGDQIMNTLGPLDLRLKGSSAWLNDLDGALKNPEGQTK